MNLKKRIFIAVAFVGLFMLTAAAQIENPRTVTDLLRRIGGNSAPSKLETEIDSTISSEGKDVFTITKKKGKPCVKGNSILALTTGINWYLNHYAFVNISWNNLSTDLSSVHFPIPAKDETHVANVDYRYYLNYCTFSYSMATWTWERWEKEIDWMALHGINLPLQIVGEDVVWRNILSELGYSNEEINAFVAGPAFQAWWAMNNLEGWGGPNPDWWYKRQEKLSGQILSRMRSYGMKPVLPGYSGMVPSNIGKKLGWNVADQGIWIGDFTRPVILNPSDAHFSDMAKLYYKHLTKLMGKASYYSMDPFHEGGSTAGLNLGQTFQGIYSEMTKVNPDAKWVIQNWGSNPRKACLDTIPRGKLIVLDLFADATPHWNQNWGGGKSFNSHDFIFCMLHNFGGRTGLHGRLRSTVSGYYDALESQKATMIGVGATPEGIETNPMLYDALFELPWRSKFSTDEWLKEYAQARYGSAQQSDKAYEAWLNLASSVYDCNTTQQGTSEPIICARPSLNVSSVSSWSTSSIYWDTEKVRKAAQLMLAEKDKLGESANYNYDLVDFMRQSITDYSQLLLKQINRAYKDKNQEKFIRLKDRFLQLILDQDSLLSTEPSFMLGSWTEKAKAVTDEAEGTTPADKDWMDWNARTQITVWSDISTSLHDYSNREWGGLLKDFHYARWKRYFDLLAQGKPTPTANEWFSSFEQPWTKDHGKSFPSVAQGNSFSVASHLFGKYFGTLSLPEKEYIFCYNSTDNRSDSLVATAYRGEALTLSLTLADKSDVAAVYIDFNADGVFSKEECTVNRESGNWRTLKIKIPKDANTGVLKALIVEDKSNTEASSNESEQTMATNILFTVSVRDKIKKARSVSARTSNSDFGSASIKGTSQTSVSTMGSVSLEAQPKDSYSFTSWTDKNGKTISTENPYTYYGKSPIVLTANFIPNKWGTIAEDKSELSTIEQYGQYLSSISITQNEKKTNMLYSCEECPSRLFNIVPQIINASRGSSIVLSWKSPQSGGLSYCRLYAYIDLNADGDFTDEGELVEVRGNKESADNKSVANGNIRIILPYDMPTALTHIRLRFDGAWNKDFEKGTDAIPAKATANRMVYELQLNVKSKPDFDPVIKAMSSDEKKGTVAIDQLSNPATVKAGNYVILRASTSKGYRFEKWIDKYGRSVSKEEHFKFVPGEDGTFTAIFK